MTVWLKHGLNNDVWADFRWNFEALPCSEWKLIVLKCNCWSINTNDPFSVIFDFGWLIVLSPPLTTVNDSQDVVVGCWQASRSLSRSGPLQMFKGNFLVLEGYPATGRPALCVSCTVVFGSQAFMTPCLCAVARLTFPLIWLQWLLFIIALYSILHGSGEKVKKWVQSSLGEERGSFFYSVPRERKCLTGNSQSKHSVSELWGHLVSTSFHPVSVLSRGSVHSPFEICCSGKSTEDQRTEGPKKLCVLELILHNRLQLAPDPNWDEHK